MKKTPLTIGSPQKLGMQLRQARVNQKITQQEMADFCDISKNHLSAIERGLHNASAQLLLQYAYKLDLSLDELVGIKEEQKILPGSGRQCECGCHHHGTGLLDTILVHAFISLFFVIFYHEHTSYTALWPPRLRQESLVGFLLHKPVRLIILMGLSINDQSDHKSNNTNRQYDSKNLF